MTADLLPYPDIRPQPGIGMVWHFPWLIVDVVEILLVSKQQPSKPCTETEAKGLFCVLYHYTVVWYWLLGYIVGIALDTGWNPCDVILVGASVQIHAPVLHGCQ